ncbi:MAG TPA: crotonase/enoyl-CoA hydratase family protein [Acidimicrobiia bacterium]|nr:crotonase/enoyl-CoA hydratase family protein [Acidimicrobiia bacterium]
MEEPSQFANLRLERRNRVGWLWLDRPDKHNALSAQMWVDIPRAVAELADDDEVRVVVVAGRGPSFTVGIDVAMLMSLQPEGASVAVQKRQLMGEIKRLQATMTSFAECPKPVIAAIHGYCLGAGMDLITACDIRLAAADAVFSVRETRLALVADVGTLQRLPRLVAAGHAAELVYTGADIDAARAEKLGLVNDVHPDAAALHSAAQALGEAIAVNSPLAVQGSKSVMRAGEQLSTDQALEHVALWNAAFLHSNDLQEAFASFTEKRDADFTGT